MNVRQNDEKSTRGSTVSGRSSTALGRIGITGRMDGNEPPSKRWIAVIDGQFIDQLNRRPAATVTGEVDIAELGRFVDSCGAIKKYYVPSGAANTVMGNTITDAGFTVWHQPPLRSSARRMPGETACVECIKGRFAEATLWQADGLIMVANGDDKAPILQDVLDRELNLMLSGRWDLVTPRLKALLWHPLAMFFDLRRDVGAA